MRLKQESCGMLLVRVKVAVRVLQTDGNNLELNKTQNTKYTGLHRYVLLPPKLCQKLPLKWNQY